MIYGLSRIDSGRVVVFDNAILETYNGELKARLELVEFFDNAILRRRRLIRPWQLELVEFFDNAILHVTYG